MQELISLLLVYRKSQNSLFLNHHLPVTIFLLFLISVSSAQPSSKSRRAEQSYPQADQAAWKIAIREQQSLSDDSFTHSKGAIKTASIVSKDVPKINSHNPHHDTRS